MQANAQQRYEERDRHAWFVDIGGFAASGYDSLVQVNSKRLGLGSLLDLEQALGIDKSVSVLKIDAAYQFNLKHRLRLSFYQTDRKGDSVVDKENIQIGDNIYGIGSQLSTEINTSVLKLGWDYSLINVKAYEAYVGLGLNVRRTELNFSSDLFVNGDDERESNGDFSSDQYIPLPTLNIGFRYNVSDNFSFIYQHELFALDYEGYGGLLKENYIGLEYQVLQNFGLGIGLSSLVFDLDVDSSEFDGKLETGYSGLMSHFRFAF
ncbi:MAG: DUF481 domain-containing protein [Pseudomonadales bacterium]|nr:DUF481 domain-containing protein [Pseudomonadales bacterium]